MMSEKLQGDDELRHKRFRALSAEFCELLKEEFGWDVVLILVSGENPTDGMNYHAEFFEGPSVAACIGTLEMTKFDQKFGVAVVRRNMNKEDE